MAYIIVACLLVLGLVAFWAVAFLTAPALGPRTALQRHLQRASWAALLIAVTPAALFLLAGVTAFAVSFWH